jgi:Uma2 family endonuclease
MSTVISPPPPAPAPATGKIDTVADLLHQLGDVPANRVLWDPIPGTATEADVVRHVDGDNKRLVELIDGTLVEKAMGTYEERLGGLVVYFIESFLDDHDIGITFGADATLRILPRQVRLPDASFVSWVKLPNRELPAEAVAALIPDLAVEVLSESNTRREMERKPRDYFTAGVRIVWQIAPEKQSAEVFTAPENSTLIGPDGELDGADVLPGFKLSLKRLFERAGRRRGS